MGKLMELIAAPFALRTLQEARAMLENVTPLRTDCGRICDGACCRPDDTGENGMLLMPFEERLYRKPIEGFPFHLVNDNTQTKDGKRLICEGTCPREQRPLACRIFPLRIRVVTDVDEDSLRVEAEIDPRAWAVCPLLEQGGMRAMSEEYIHAIEKAGALLCRNVYMLEALLNEQRFLDETRHL